MIQRRDNAVVALHDMRGMRARPLSALSPQQRQYWTGFEEWFAEQVARWGTSDQNAVTTVERFFKSLADTLKAIFKAAAQKFNLPYEPSKAMGDWLNLFHTDAQPFAQDGVRRDARANAVFELVHLLGDPAE